jgi:hypothetical protein
MIRPLRKTHGAVFLVLAILLPAVFLSGIAFRHTWSVDKGERGKASQAVSSGTRP